MKRLDERPVARGLACVGLFAFLVLCGAVFFFESLAPSTRFLGWLLAISVSGMAASSILSSRREAGGRLQQGPEDSEVEDTSRAADPRYQVLLEHSLEMFSELDLSGRYCEVSASFAEGLGYRREDLVGEPSANLLFDLEDGAPFAHLTVPGAGPQNGTIRARTREGDARVLGWRAVPFRGADGGTRVLAFSRDITARVLAEERFGDLFRRAPDAMVAIDSNGVIALFSEQAEALFGWPASEVVGRPVEILIPRRYRVAHRRAIPEFMAAPRDRSFSELPALHALRKDGSEVPVEIRLSAIPADAELQVAASIRDVSGRLQKEAEERALETRVRHAQKLDSLGLLAGGVAHDLNNLLAGMVNWTALALVGLDPDSPVRNAILEIRSLADQMGGLAGQMLAYAGEEARSEQVTDLNGEIRKMRTLIRSSVPKKAILEDDLGSDLPAVFGNPAQIRQVVLNLVMNASEALRGGEGCVRLRTGLFDEDRIRLGDELTLYSEPPEAAVYLEVSDTGCGIDPEALEHIFEPFFSTKASGRGLGLAAVAGIVRSNGGAIGVASSLGSGSRFVVAFPPAGRIPGTALEEGREPARLDGRRILVADDETSVREAARLFLETRGAEVVDVDEGRAALRALLDPARTFDAAVLDLTMPGLGGDEVLRRLRASQPDLPVVLCSGFQRDVVASQTAADPYVRFTQKPYDLDEVVRWIAETSARKSRLTTEPTTA